MSLLKIAVEKLDPSQRLSLEIKMGLSVLVQPLVLFSAMFSLHHESSSYPVLLDQSK